MRALLLLTVLAACGDSGAIYVFDGAAQTADFETSQYYLSVVAAGDVDGDGHPDFFAASDTATELYLGVHANADASSSDDSGLIPIGDVNADGRADFLLATEVGYYSSIEQFYPGSADPFAGSGIALGDNVVAAAGVDIDGDGITDLVVVTDESTFEPQMLQCGIGVYRGGPGFDATAAPESLLTTQIDSSPQLALQSAGDIDGDGREDLVVGGACLGSGELAVYFGGVSLSALPSRVLATGTFPIVARDFDGDGFGDLAVSDGSDVLVYFGPGLDDARLKLAGTLADAGDIDGDGYPDVVVITPSYDVGVYLGGPAMDDVLDIDLPQASGRPFSSAAYRGSGELVAAYSGWRAE
jgi:FG-GAP-like repeat/FG-GAP repeat